MTKSELRIVLRRERAAIPAVSARRAAFEAAEKLLRRPEIRKAHHIAAYLDAGSELQTAPLISTLLALGKQVYVPKIIGTRMRFIKLRAGMPLRTRQHGIAEPTASYPARSLRTMDVVILPLVGVDAHGVRLGSGGGYYDRALAFPCAFCQPRLIGYGYAQQQVARIPADAWDTRLDAYASERGFQNFNR